MSECKIHGSIYDQMGTKHNGWGETPIYKYLSGGGFREWGMKQGRTVYLKGSRMGR